MRRSCWACVALFALSSGAAAETTANDSTRYIAANCSNCHGTSGRAVGAMPSIAGLRKDYFVEQMQRFREGKRPATVMQQIAKGYPEQETEQLAEFFSRLPSQ